MPDRVATEPQNRSEAGSAGSASAGVSDSGKYREVRLERHLGEIAEPFEYEAAEFGLLFYRLCELQACLSIDLLIPPLLS